jgi:hypothetical protein
MKLLHFLIEYIELASGIDAVLGWPVGSTVVHSREAAAAVPCES